ncbi:MAG: T9SS type A sorting domain-containing protein [bacterium]
MKKIMVIFFIVLSLSAEWQQREEFTLPKGIIVNDIKVDINGKIWILTRSSLAQFDYNTKGLTLIAETQNSKIFALNNEGEFFLVDNNRLLLLNKDNESRSLLLNLTNPIQLEVFKIDKRDILAISEGNRLIFSSGDEIIGTLNANIEKFSLLPHIEEQKIDLTIYTMSGNQIYSWTSSQWNNPATYHSQLIFSASEPIIDFSTGLDGKNYILFKDSILILKPNGDRGDKIPVENVPYGSKILVYPADNLLALFDRNNKTLKIFSPATKVKNDIVQLKKNRPNPVENYTEFEFTINEPMIVTLTIYNLIGKPVKVLASGYHNKGTYIIPWHADDEKGMSVPNGIYFYRLETKRGVLIKQLIVLR